MKKVQTIKRANAAKLIDGLMIDIAAWLSPEVEPNEKCQQAIDILLRLKDRIAEAGLTHLELCPGEAHSNPHIDNCMVCMPRWGYVGPEVKIT